MAGESSIFGSGLDSNQADYSPSGPAQFGGGADAGASAGAGNTDALLPPNAQPTEGQAPAGMFGSGLSFGPPRYTSDPQAAPLDAASSLLQQRIQRATSVSSNPIAQALNPEGVAAARAAVPQMTEQLLKIQQQKATIGANRQQAQTLGLAPGEVPDEADMAARVEVARSKALGGDLKVFKGLQAVDPKTAEAIAPQVHEAVAGHLGRAQYAFDKLSNMTTQGEYEAAVTSLRRDGVLGDLETLGLKVPKTFEEFSAAKAREGQALREARIGMNDLRTKLEERNTYQPMETKEADTYKGRLTTAYGDQITNGTWSRNAASGTRGFVVNGADDPRNLGKSFTLATPEQRKEIRENIEQAIPKAEMEKYRAENRTYTLATTDGNGKPLPEGKINSNPNVQQGIAEGLASMLRGGSGGANLGLLKIETSKRGYIQGLIDKISTEKAGVINELKGKDVTPYLSHLTETQMRDVLDALKQYNDVSIGSRATALAERAGALGLKPIDLGLGKEEVGGIGEALERGRQAQVARMMPYHQAIGGGDGVFQLGAQRPGTGAAPLPPGTGPATQQPGAPALQTPVQQGQNPSPVPPSPAAPQGPTPQPGGGGGPQTIAGQSVSVPPIPGVSPTYVQNMQRIESGNERDPWKAGAKGSSASGAFQFINSTWAANKPAGAPDRAADATPQQQAEAVATLTARNAAGLKASGLPVNDTNVYIAHNLGLGGASALLRADPSADARTVVGEKSASNNPLFFKGKPTVATVLARYQAEMNGSLDDTGPKPKPGSGGATAEQPSFMQRVSRMFSQGVQGGDEGKDKAVADVGEAATEHAPAIGSTIGAIGGGAVAGPAGAVGGGAVGGGAGQALKDWLQGRDQNPTAIAKETALGGVLGVGGAARPILSAAARAGGAGAVEAGAKAAEGGDAGDIAQAGMEGAGNALMFEGFGRALGMAGHKVWNMFAPDAKKAVQSAAAKYSEAEAALATEAKTLPGAGGAAGGPNPKYEAAQKAKDEAETVLKDAGLKPEEAAYAHKVSSEGVPKQEAEVARPGALAKEDIGKGYQQLENEVGAATQNQKNLKPTPKLSDGPLAAVENKKVSADHAELAREVETAITAPAPNWQAKWVQLKDERSKLLTLEREAENSTVPGRSRIARDMRTLADTVRKQQEKAAKYVFGEQDGEAFMKRLNTLDVRYRNLMEATNGGDIAKAAALKGEAGREAQRKFEAFAHDDPTAIAAYRAMRKGGSNVENDVRTLVGAEKMPYIGPAITWAKMATRLGEWNRERVAGSPVKFKDLIKMPGFWETDKPIRDLFGTAAQRGATM